MTLRNPLEPNKLYDTIEQLFPTSTSPDQQTTGPTSLLEVVVTLLHANFAAVDFRLIDINGDRVQNNLVPAGWTGKSTYLLNYRHTQSSLTFQLKIHEFTQIYIHFQSVEEKKASTVQIQPKDYFRDELSFPLSSYQPQVYSSIFKRSSSPEDLLNLFKSKIIQVLIPGLNKPGYEDDRQETTSSAEIPRASRSRPSPERPRYHPPNVPLFVPSFPGNPLSVGESDLDPLASSPNLFPSSRRRHPLDENRSGGMLVGPDHPMFDRDRGNPRIYGGPQPLPPGAVPPGARFDPIGPFGANPNRRSNQGPGNQFSGEPDSDELPPPGYMDMFM